jgi:ATP-dependent Clp protease adaptor protein ClpS
MDVKELEKVNNDVVDDDLKSLILFNSGHYWDEVVTQLQKATGFDILQCEQIAMIAHTKGKAVVISGDVEKLLLIENVLKEIKLVTEIK